MFRGGIWFSSWGLGGALLTASKLQIPFTAPAAAAVSGSHQGMEDPARVSVIRARRPPMQVDAEEEDEEDEEDEERGDGREEKVECPICGEVTSDQLHYGGLACPSCKAFFRRTVAIHRSPFDVQKIPEGS